MKKTILTSAISICFLFAKANNIQVSNVSLQNQSAGTHTIEVHFDVAWENSWRTSTNESNYDGAWIFVKYQKNGNQLWNHCVINTSGYYGGNNSAITVAPDSVGAFIYHTTDTIGDVSYHGNYLTWNYAANGIGDNDLVSVWVCAIEMVYIPSGGFYLGSGGTETSTFRDGNSSNPYYVSSAGAIPVGTTTGNLYSTLTINGTSIPSSFPNGFDAYWIMKYECSQQQYADFLNHVTLTQATALKLSTNQVFGNTTYPSFGPLAPERANNYTGISEYVAYADWCGLRPVSEMEFEKACRGSGGVNFLPFPDEYAWGNDVLVQVNSVTSPGASNEAVDLPSNANANLYWSTLNHPLRAGIFARDTGSTRQSSGATYYGVMNMSDNVYEITIYAGSNPGQNVSKLVHGDGHIAANGNSDEPSWLNATAFGLRGGYYGSGLYAKVSDRTNANYSTNGYNEQKGIRLARTAQ